MNDSPQPARRQPRPTRQDLLNAKPRTDGKVRILRLGDGLDLHVMPGGAKRWRTKAQRNGRRTTVTIGAFPAMGIEEARAARLRIRLAADPGRERREERAAAVDNTVRMVAGRWVSDSSLTWKSSYLSGIQQQLRDYVLPALGNCAIDEVTLDHVRTIVRPLFDTKPAVAIAVRYVLSGLFSYAVDFQLIPFNPVHQIKRRLPQRSHLRSRPQPHVTTIEEARAVLRAFEINAHRKSPWVVLMNRLIALTGVRKVEAIGAQWGEIDLDKAIWTIPAERMKAKREHVVVLARQTVELFRATRKISDREGIEGEIVFPASWNHGKSLHVGTLNKMMRDALRGAKLGQRTMTPHGWRGTFSTIMNERDHAAYRVIDIMLAHAAFDPVERRYNHARYLPERFAIAQAWADLLLDGAPSAGELAGLEKRVAAGNVVPLRRRAA